MLQKVEAMFADMAPMLKGLKKKKYETNMKEFREKNNEFIKNHVYVCKHPTHIFYKFAWL